MGFGVQVYSGSWSLPDYSSNDGNGNFNYLHYQVLYDCTDGDCNGTQVMTAKLQPVVKMPADAHRDVFLVAARAYVQQV